MVRIFPVVASPRTCPTEPVEAACTLPELPEELELLLDELLPEELELLLDVGVGVGLVVWQEKFEFLAM